MVQFNAWKTGDGFAKAHDWEEKLYTDYWDDMRWISS